MGRNEVREVVVVETIRLPIGKSSRAQMDKFGGYYRNTSSQDMLASILESLVDRAHSKSSSFDAREIEDVQVNSTAMLDQFHEGYQKYKKYWEEILSTESYNDLLTIRRESFTSFIFPVDVWAKIVYDFAVYFHFSSTSK